MFPYKTSLKLDRKGSQSLYLQLSNQFIQLIKEQKLKPKTKLPGSRSLAELLNVHRKTVVACYDELMLQGWVESIAKKGTFVHRNLPLLEQTEFSKSDFNTEEAQTGFSFYKNSKHQNNSKKKDNTIIYLNDGISDGRLTPMDEIARTYRRIAVKKNVYKHLGYNSVYGSDTLREVLVNYLNETRGLQIAKENILITRGSQMGIWLSSQLLLKEHDIIVVGETNYASANATFSGQKAILKTVLVDENGIMTDEIEIICKKQQIKAVYVTSHHHHPTTVTLSAERRIHLLNLSKQYNFAIIEDDYDYDFNYNHAPILPLKSHDLNKNVIYIGSICKTVAPVFRVGYLIASKEFVDEAANRRKIVDRQGDELLELTFADFIKSGDLDRHIRKVMKVYKQRRDLFCYLLDKELGGFFKFDKPKGGMAVWTILNQEYSWKQVAKEALKSQLEIGDYSRYEAVNTNHNAIRIGFASYNEKEIYELIAKLKTTMLTLKN
ncbi:MocR-like pyridoxine biosynthesis transcription factor PdxR [Tenacibaculum haliotis]|uniref:MocR-like pyridoxine biosynthesis transcription factor PdxR n=1 Tax=Tenacibaculum haliotis TaxID=1888914 RepID=UPI0021AF7892|nr:PLP-dependent aminotransferase family protein [Tenacibaculum haliotis]MCT4698801.1 PLP-dependent aminotransferase family protein [Tenacibaculum haliotis]